MAYFLTIHNLKVEVGIIYGTFLLLIVGVSHFSILRKNLPNNYMRMLLKHDYPHIKIFQYFSSDSIYLDPPSSPPSHLFSSTPIITDKTVLSLCAKTAVQVLYLHFYYQYTSLFLLYKKFILLNIHKFLKAG